jgi:hypothetical protein
LELGEVGADDCFLLGVVAVVEHHAFGLALIVLDHFLQASFEFAFVFLDVDDDGGFFIACDSIG